MRNLQVQAEGFESKPKSPNNSLDAMIDKNLSIKNHPEIHYKFKAKLMNLRAKHNETIQTFLDREIAIFLATLPREEVFAKVKAANNITDKKEETMFAAVVVVSSDEDDDETTKALEEKLSK